MTADLAERAAKLVSPAMRRRLAADLERLVEASERPAASFSSAVPVWRNAVNATRPQLLTLAAELRSPQAVRAQGVALTRLLLTDGGSPLYRPSGKGALGHAVEEARWGLLHPNASRG